MGTTMLERANPLNELRPAPQQARGRARRVLAELDTEVTQIMSAVEDAGTMRRRPALTPVPRPQLAPIRPVPVNTTERPEGRQHLYPVTWNLPAPKPRRRAIPGISVMRVAKSGPATPSEMPRTLTWLPMLRGHESVNAEHDKIWRQWLSGWDRTIVTGYRLARTKVMALRIEERTKHRAIAAKLRRITEYHTRGVWQDYLDAFGPLEGTQNTCAHVMDALEKLSNLAQA